MTIVSETMDLFAMLLGYALIVSCFVFGVYFLRLILL